MPKFVILGSCRYEPYEMLVMPNKFDAELYERDHEKAFDEACKITQPAMKKADIVLIYAPNGEVGEHTARDLEFALRLRKKVVWIT